MNVIQPQGTARTRHDISCDYGKAWEELEAEIRAEMSREILQRLRDNSPKSQEEKEALTAILANERAKCEKEFLYNPKDPRAVKLLKKAYAKGKEAGDKETEAFYLRQIPIHKAESYKKGQADLIEKLTGGEALGEATLKYGSVLTLHGADATRDCESCRGLAKGIIEAAIKKASESLGETKTKDSNIIITPKPEKPKRK